MFAARIRHPQLTRRFAVGNREVLVFDGLVPRPTARLLYEELRDTTFHWNARDSGAAEHRHSVRWKKAVAPEAKELPFFGDVARLVERVGRHPLVLDRIYVNYNLYGELHLPHVDAAFGITALYCANLEWRRDWQGETVFYDGDEPTHVVLPRPGRVLLFDAALRHRGSPPSRDCYEPRINIAFKFQRAR
jgi:hypothetical protein